MQTTSLPSAMGLCHMAGIVAEIIKSMRVDFFHPHFKMWWRLEALIPGEIFLLHPHGQMVICIVHLSMVKSGGCQLREEAGLWSPSTQAFGKKKPSGTAVLIPNLLSMRRRRRRKTGASFPLSWPLAKLQVAPCCWPFWPECGSWEEKGGCNAGLYLDPPSNVSPSTLRVRWHRATCLFLPRGQERRRWSGRKPERAMSNSQKRKARD